jgi:hypothetical protein
LTTVYFYWPAIAELTRKVAVTADFGALACGLLISVPVI